MPGVRASVSRALVVSADGLGPPCSVAVDDPAEFILVGVEAAARRARLAAL